MGKRSLLLVDGDARSLRVLEVSLRKAGFLITTAVNGRDALDKARTSRPDLILSDTDMPEMDGFALCRELKADPSLARVPFVFLTGETAIESKIRGLELGVDEYLTKPIYIKEILTRIRILLQKQQRARLETKRDPNTRFAGTLHDMGVVDLIQTIEVSRKSGLIHFTSSDVRQATIYFRNGAVIDAEIGHLQGADAVYRLLTWSEGEFELLFRTVRRKDAIDMGTQALLMEGMRRLDEWGRLLEQLPQLATRFEVDVTELAERLAELPDELNHILRLFDGRRSLIDVIDLAGGGDLECIELVSRLYFEGLLHEVEGPPVDTAPEVTTDVALEGWLGRQIPPDDRLPALDPLPAEVAAEAEAEWDASDADAAAEMMWPSQPAVATPDAPREEAGAVVGSASGESSGRVVAEPAGRSSRSSSFPPADESGRSRSSSPPPVDGGGRSPRSSSSPPAVAGDVPPGSMLLDHEGRRVLIPPPTVGPVPAGSVAVIEWAASAESEGSGAEDGRAVVDVERAGDDAGRAGGGPDSLQARAGADGAPAESVDASTVSEVPGATGDDSLRAPRLAAAPGVAGAAAAPAAPSGDDAEVLSAQGDAGSGRASTGTLATEEPATGTPAIEDPAAPLLAQADGTSSADSPSPAGLRDGVAADPPAGREPGADADRAQSPAVESVEDPEEAEFGAITEPFERARRESAERLARREAAEKLARREAAEAAERSKRESAETWVGRRPGESRPGDEVTRREPGAGPSNGHAAVVSRDAVEGAEFGADTDRLEPDLRDGNRPAAVADVDSPRRPRGSGADGDSLRRLAGHADDSEDAEFEAETGKFPAELRELVRRRAAGLRDQDASAGHALSAEAQEDAEFEADTQRLPPELRAASRRRSGVGLGLDVEGDTQQLPGDLRERVRRRTGRGVADVIESRMLDLSRDAAGRSRQDRGAEGRRRGLVALEGGRSGAGTPDVDETTPVLPEAEAASFDRDFEDLTPNLALHELGLRGREFGADTEELPAPIEDVGVSSESGESPAPVLRVGAEVLRATEQIPGPVLVAGTSRATGEFPGPVMSGDVDLLRATEEFPGPLREADESPRATGEFPGPVVADEASSPRAMGEFPGPLMADESSSPRATGEFPGPVMAGDGPRATEELSGPVLRVNIEVLRSSRDLPGSLLTGVPAGSAQARGAGLSEVALESPEDTAGSLVDIDADEPPTPPSGVLGLGSALDRGEGPVLPLGRVTIVRRPAQVHARADVGPDVEAAAFAPDVQDWSAEGGDPSSDATPVPLPAVFGEGSLDLASSSARTESADPSPASPESSDASAAPTAGAGVSSARPQSAGAPVEPPGSVVSDPFDVAAGAIAPLEASSAPDPSGPDPFVAGTPPAEVAASASPGATAGAASAAAAGTPAGPGDAASASTPPPTTSPTAKSTPSGADSPAASQPLPAAAAAAAVFSLAASGGEATGILEAEFGTGDIADFDTSDLTPLPNPVPLGDERSNPRIKSSRGAEVAMVSGEVAAQPRPRPDPDGSDVVPLSSRQGDRQNGARADRASTARPVVSPVGSSSGSGNGSLRKVELDQELSAAAEIVELVPPRPAIAVPLASAEGPAGKLGRARRSPARGAEVGPAADDIDTAPVRRPSTRVSAMLRAASGHSLARTVAATIGAAVLVGACFGLLFWWFGARNDASSGEGEAGIEVAGSEPAEATAPTGAHAAGIPAAGDSAQRTPIASGTGDFAHATAAEAPGSPSGQPSSAPPARPSSAAATSDTSPPPSAALPVAAGSRSYDDLYEEAKRARRRRDYHAVLSLAERALAHQETAQALTLQAEAMTALGDSRRALSIADRAIEVRSRFSSAWYIKGRIHRTLGENDQARAAFERYLELDPEGSRADQVIDLLQDM